jgi:hypothetical protein
MRRALLLLSLLLCAACSAFAQGSHHIDIAITNINGTLTPLSSAQVRVCAPTATGTPCNSLASIYSDVALTQVLANPLTADQNGNFDFYAAPGFYMIQISSPNVTTQTQNYVPLPPVVGVGTGTVVSFSAGSLNPIFTTSVSTPTTTPSLSFTLSNAGGGTVFGNPTGSAGAPAYTFTPVLGIPGTSLGILGFAGSTSGTVSVQAQPAAGTWTFQWPTGPGLPGQVMSTNGFGVASWANAGAGTVTTFSSGNLSPLFITSVSNPTSTPGLSFTLSNAAGGTVFGNASGSSGLPSYTSTPVLGIPGATLGTLGLAGSTSGTLTLAPAAAGTNYTFQFPANGGTSGYVLTTNGSGVTIWAAGSAAWSALTNPTANLALSMGTFQSLFNFGAVGSTPLFDFEGTNGDTNTGDVVKIGCGSTSTTNSTCLEISKSRQNVQNFLKFNDPFNSDSMTFFLNNLTGFGWTMTGTGTALKIIDENSNTPLLVNVDGSTLGCTLDGATTPPCWAVINTQSITGTTRPLFSVIDVSTHAFDVFVAGAALPLGLYDSSLSLGSTSVCLHGGSAVLWGTCGTVTSIGLTQTGSIFTITGSPVTSTGNINIAFASQSANTVIGNCTGSSAAPTDCSITAAMLPSTVFLDNQSNTVTTGTQDFSAATAFKIPVAAGATTSANGAIIYDTTNKMTHLYQNGADAILMEFPASASWANGDCVKVSVVSSVVTFVDTGSACGSGGGGTGSTNQVAYFSATNTVTGLTLPADTRVHVFTGTSTGAPAWQLSGIVGNTQTSSYTVNSSGDDRGKYVFANSSSAFTLTLPAAGTASSTDSNFYGAVYNENSGPVTIASSSTIQGNTNVPETALALYHTPDNSTWQTYVIPTLVASGSTALTTSGISSGTCSSATTVSAPGVTTSMMGHFIPQGDPTGVTGYVPSSSGSLYIWMYLTANNVNFKVCNNTSSTITPSALTVEWSVP